MRGEPVTDGQFWYHAVKINDPEQEKFHIWRMRCDGEESEIILEADADQWPLLQSLDAHLDPAARLVVFSREEAIYFFLNNSKDFSLRIFRRETGESCAQQVGQTKPMKDAVFCGERDGLPVFSTWDGEELIYLQLDLDTGETSELFRRDAGGAAEPGYCQRSADCDSSGVPHGQRICKAALSHSHGAEKLFVGIRQCARRNSDFYEPGRGAGAVWQPAHGVCTDLPGGLPKRPK